MEKSPFHICGIKLSFIYGKIFDFGRVIFYEISFSHRYVYVLRFMLKNNLPLATYVEYPFVLLTFRVGKSKKYSMFSLDNYKIHKTGLYHVI